jgi:predicted Zn-dependent protease
MEEAIERAGVALALDPPSLWHGEMLASVYWVVRRYDEAIEQCRRTLEMDPHRSATLYRLVWLKTEQAVDSLRPDPRFPDLLRRLNLPE